MLLISKESKFNLLNKRLGNILRSKMKQNQIMKKKLLKHSWSAFSVALTFILGFAAINATAQLNETFDNTTTPAGWLNTNSASTSTTYQWRFTGNPGYGMSGTLEHTGNGGSFGWVDGSYTGTTSLESPSFSMVGTINPELRFWIKRAFYASITTYNTFTVDVFDGTTWNTAVFTHTTQTANSDWEQMSVSLSGFTFTEYG